MVSIIVVIIIVITVIMITRCVKLPSLESGNVDAEQCTVGLGQPQCQMVMMWWWSWWSRGSRWSSYQWWKQGRLETWVHTVSISICLVYKIVWDAFWELHWDVLMISRVLVVAQWRWAKQNSKKLLWSTCNDSWLRKKLLTKQTKTTKTWTITKNSQVSLSLPVQVCREQLYGEAHKPKSYKQPSYNV